MAPGVHLNFHPRRHHRVLVSDSLVHRYEVAASPDGRTGREGTFSMCSFWWVEALARAGRLDEARPAIEKMLTYPNHAGLYSEEILPTGQHLRISADHTRPFLDTGRSLPAAPEASTCSARSAARTNDVDTDKRWKTINRRGRTTQDPYH